MMNFLIDAVKRLEETIGGSGCEGNDVILRRVSGEETCPYPDGIPIRAEFGGKTADFLTDYPIEARTRVSFMFGRPLNSPEQRTAAVGIINAVTKFLCLSRKGHACNSESHAPCLEALKSEINGRRVFCNGHMPALESALSSLIVSDPAEAEVILVTGGGLFTDEGLGVIAEYRESKELLFIGPATSGVAALSGCEHWCPYGRT